MANILYGVNGEGAGHSTRSREIIRHLAGAGHTVHVVSFDRGLASLGEEFEVTEIFGLRFAYVNNRVRYRRTAAKNLAALPRAARSFRKLLGLMDEWRIDVVCTDFEPLSCHAARHKRLPVISIDNQHCLVHADVTYPRQYRREAAVAKAVTRLMTPHADAYLVLSFFTPPVRHPRTWVFPPILRREILEAAPSDAGRVLVYVTSPAPALAELLAGVRDAFTCYGFGKEGEQGNLLFKKASVEGFLKDLVTCRAVIANAGFSLLSEALHLGKPYLAVPVKHQFEQAFNAIFVEQMGYGAHAQRLREETVEAFLFNLDSYREKLAAYPRQGNSALFAKLDSLIGELTAKPVRRAAGACKR